MDGWLKLGFVEANPNLATQSPSDLQIVWIGWCVLKLAGPIDLMDMEKDFVLTFWFCWWSTKINPAMVVLMKFMVPSGWSTKINPAMVVKMATFSATKVHGFKVQGNLHIMP